MLKDDAVKVLHSICQPIWKTQQWPQDWKRSVFIPISKKGIDTLYEYHVYEIFAVFKTSANLNAGFRYHMMVDAENEEDFNAFINECKRLSFYETGITPTYGDKTICLSTCEYTLDNGRLVVCARRVF